MNLGTKAAQNSMRITLSLPLALHRLLQMAHGVFGPLGTTLPPLCGLPHSGKHKKAPSARRYTRCNKSAHFVRV